MGACHGVHIEGFAAGGSLALEFASVPGCSSELTPVVMVLGLRSQFAARPLLMGNQAELT